MIEEDLHSNLPAFLTSLLLLPNLAGVRWPDGRMSGCLAGLRAAALLDAEHFCCE